MAAREAGAGVRKARRLVSCRGPDRVCTNMLKRLKDEGDLLLLLLLQQLRETAGRLKGLFFFF